MKGQDSDRQGPIRGNGRKLRNSIRWRILVYGRMANRKVTANQ